MKSDRKRRYRLAAGTLGFLTCIALAPAMAKAGEPAAAPAFTCSPLPRINPKLDFAGNFNNPCYAIKLIPGRGTSEVGDLNAIYTQVYYQIAPGYELVVLGTYPNARFMSATAYDDHLAIVSTLVDQAIAPLAGSANPYAVGAQYAPGQKYGLTVSFGFGPPATVTKGCQTDPAIDANFMDASQIHSGLTWTGYPNLPDYFPPHETGANAAGAIQIRKYLDIASTPSETVIVRQLSDGCALSAANAMAQNVLTTSQTTSSTWLHQTQINAHQQFATVVEPDLCYPSDPRNKAFWLRTRDYVPLDNGAAAAIQATVQPAGLQAMMAGQAFMRVEFQAATTPTTPCATPGCSLTGDEQLRYYSVSLQNGSNTLLSIADSALVKDPSGNVTILMSMGAVPPAFVTPQNYYNYIDLTKVANYQTLQTLFVRNLIPNAAFPCSAFNVPFYTTEFNPSGGFMGAYVPTVDFPAGNRLPTIPVPPGRADTCLIPPPPPGPVQCSVP